VGSFTSKDQPIQISFIYGEMGINIPPEKSEVLVDDLFHGTIPDVKSLTTLNVMRME
jgi:hypothetical protein